MEPSTAVYYLVCVDEPGGPLFDGTGTLHEDMEEAVEELREIRGRVPHAYLAMVTYERCPECTGKRLLQGGLRWQGNSSQVH